MNPDVTDIPERFRLTSGNVQLLTMGSVTQGNSGCVCPEYVLIKNLISYLLLNGKQDMVIDMEAGLEHLGRGVTQKMDVLFIVTQPDRVSYLTASRIYRLATDLHVRTVLGIGNEVRGGDDQEFLKKAIDDFDFAAFFPECNRLREHVRQGKDIAEIPELNDAAEDLLSYITEKVNG
jgi:CO dehydrogenase maturation factor